MECPLCGSRAVVARTSVDDYISKVQQGADPYDLIYIEKAEAECKSCGHVFSVPPND
ncbi:MAG: hypothetical protein KKB20_07085 [Proteobacteria bacterium]|nr:hypothetical protein [Pseudomonadota bacterium]